MPNRNPPGDPKIIRMLRDFRLSLIAREDEQIKRLGRQWINIENSLIDEMTLLALQINEAKASGAVITEQLIRRMSRYEALQSQMKREILSFAKDDATKDISAEQIEYGEAALQIGVDVINMQFRIPPFFDVLPASHVETFSGLLGNGSPLYSLLKEAYPDALDGVIKALLEGTAKGLPPGTVALNMAKDMGMGFDRIMLIARTEQLRVSRLVSADQYRESGLEGVMKRVATKDDATCMACLMLDGEIIPLDKELDDHPRGRCTAIFQIKGVPTIQWEKGADWFERQSEDVQRDMMGDAKWEAWQDGKFQLSDLAGKVDNDIWGSSPSVPSLSDLLGGQSGSMSPVDDIPPLPNEGGELSRADYFRDANKADAQLSGIADMWSENLSDEQKSALIEYTNDGYVAMNNVLRTGENSSSDVLENIKLIQEALDKSLPTPIDLQVTRGFRYPDLYDALQSGSVNVGDTLTDQGFMSTSVMNNIRDQKGQINYDIFIPKGSTGLSYLDGLSGIPEEAEVLFSPGTPLKIKEINKLTNGGIVVILEIIK